MVSFLKRKIPMDVKNIKITDIIKNRKKWACFRVSVSIHNDSAQQKNGNKYCQIFFTVTQAT